MVKKPIFSIKSGFLTKPKTAFIIPGMKTLMLLAVMFGVILSPGASRAGPLCHGRFINPITDINWINLFPITIAGIPVMKGNPLLPDTIIDHAGLPVCVCPIPVPPYIRPGLPIGFWEPVRLSEVVRKPFCFPSLGGLDMGKGVSMLLPRGGNFAHPAGSSGMGASGAPTGQLKKAFYQVHWIANPMLFILNLITDVACLEREPFDILYLTELDPTWDASELATILNPDALLFANPIAQAACAADCLAATAYLPLDPLFWCGGCQGSLYPFTGHVTGTHTGGIRTSLKLTERFQFKMHRELLAVISSIRQGQCHNYPWPIVLKSQYRYQLVLPIRQVILPSQPFGRSTMLISPFKEFPVMGEDFVWQSWRKQDCCAF